MELSYAHSRDKKRTVKIITFLAVAALVAVSISFLDINIPGLQHLSRNMSLLSGFLLPDWQAVPELLEPLFFTVLLALLGTFLGAILSVFAGLAGARNLSPAWLSITVRNLLGIERALPEVVTLLFLVAALGLGPFPGIMALALGSMGMLGRLFADAIEEMDISVIQSIRSTGASRWQVMYYGVLHPLSASLVSLLVFRLEVNIRHSIILGAVGAGGIGYELLNAFRYLDYPRGGLAVLMIFILAMATEKMTSLIRKKLSVQNIG